MLWKLAKLIQNHPWIVVTLIIMITIGFSIFIPSLQFKTDFEDFMPEDELVDANNRIQEYFGQTEPLIIIRWEKENSENVITPNAIHEIQYLQNNLEKNQYVNGMVLYFPPGLYLSAFHKQDPLKRMPRGIL